MTFHPLDPLDEAEITILAKAATVYATEKLSIKALKHISITPIEPPKLAVLNYLQIPLSSDPNYVPPATDNDKIDRKAQSIIVNCLTGDTFDLTLIIDGAKAKVLHVVQLPDNHHACITPDELDLADQIVRRDPGVIAAAAAVGVAPEHIAADGWAIGYDPRFPEKVRLQQCLLYARYSEDSNLYSHPLDFFPVIDANLDKVIHIDYAPHRIGNNAKSVSTIPPALEDDHLIGRERIKPPQERFEYLPELMPKEFKYREVKPLHITQPEGVNFKITGKGNIEWQKWNFHIGFHPREGPVFSTVTYNDDGVKRPLFYRMSLAEMVVPYADPQHPHPRKHAFDVGEYFIGTLANDLTLGCDCLGSIAYLSGAFVGNDGKPKVIKNAICIHEEDAGILWKHTDYRPNGRSHAVRSRKLVVQMVCTVANYEYLFAMSFFQDGTIELETRLTGILNIYVLGEGETDNPYGTEVAPRVNAHYHQHIFSLRIDPMIDGIANSVVETDIETSTFPTGSHENWAGNAFGIKQTVLETTDDGRRDFDATKSRTWTIIGGKTHYASGKQGGYKIHSPPTVPLLAQPDSAVAKRAPWANSTLWVTPHDPEQFYPSGLYVPQTREVPDDSILSWMKGKKSIKETDVVLYLTFGTTHIPRPEDFPVMPAEHLRVTLKPSSFFKMNPALDVPATKDARSVNALGTGASTNGTGSSCCAA